MTRVLVAAAILLAAVIPTSAQSPVVNASVEKRTPSADFARDVQSVASRPTAAWIGYRVPIQRRRDVSIQGYDGCCGQGALDGRAAHIEGDDSRA